VIGLERRGRGRVCVGRVTGGVGSRANNHDWFESRFARRRCTRARFSLRYLVTIENFSSLFQLVQVDFSVSCVVIIVAIVV
jgi:hypothetical protein